ncbi:alpha/beta fold hydrolase [Methylobacterium brachythecii]|uniref:Homoserine O-acetyltransferase n=1 Tax=Methylobacterium brachythecii TaxID=1176177 RepID=A0A7W6ACF9_9HYPH|nr:alpha/beta fold hydrolase [Methylobacterium brachythecii]MBB3900685.1 homoserine O-acetyltransferase [Methylobacterium brachythecii]
MASGIVRRLMTRHGASTFRGRSRRSAALVTFAVLLSAGGTGAAESTKPVAPALEQRETDATYNSYRLRSGEAIEQLRLHYATLGSPHRNAAGEIDNAVLVLHWTGNSGASLLTPEYKASLFAAGKPLDASRYYLIFPDNLGHGRSTKPSDGLRNRFPRYGYGDIVDVQHRLVTETLGIRRLHAILGMSMGGMNAWQWAEAYPDQVGAIMPVVALPVPISGRNLLWRRMAAENIRNDPEWKANAYTGPTRGYAVAQQFIRLMIDGVPHFQTTIPTVTAADAFIAGIAKPTPSADPNDILYSLESSQDYDPRPGFSALRMKVFALNFEDDEFNPDRLQILQQAVKTLPNARFVVQAGSPDSYGHLTMAHPALWAGHVGAFMDWIEGRPNKAGSH